VIWRVVPSWSVIVHLVPIFAIALSVSFWILLAVARFILTSPCTTIRHSGAQDDQAISSRKKKPGAWCAPVQSCGFRVTLKTCSWGILGNLFSEQGAQKWRYTNGIRAGFSR
jgi:hypothetical protein